MAPSFPERREGARARVTPTGAGTRTGARAGTGAARERASETSASPSLAPSGRRVGVAIEGTSAELANTAVLPVSLAAPVLLTEGSRVATAAISGTVPVVSAIERTDAVTRVMVPGAASVGDDVASRERTAAGIVPGRTSGAPGGAAEMA